MSKHHPRNLHQGSYDLVEISKSSPELLEFIFTNSYGTLTLDFSDPKAVLALNRALLKHDYQIDFWEIPAGFLCPPIPGRADYIHFLADLLIQSNNQKRPNWEKIRMLDLGTGANLIYPILGVSSYGWSFVGSEINLIAFESALKIKENNPSLKSKVELRLQGNSSKLFDSVILSDEFFDLTCCNPPFFESEEEALHANRRKVQNLKGIKAVKPSHNFGGQANELWTEGGELQFLRKMALESTQFKHQVFWFTSLVSKSAHVNPMRSYLEKLGVTTQKVIEMEQGNKKSRFIAWTFLNAKQQESWKSYRWK